MEAGTDSLWRALIAVRKLGHTCLYGSEVFFTLWSSAVFQIGEAAARSAFWISKVLWSVSWHSRQGLTCSGWLDYFWMLACQRRCISYCIILTSPFPLQLKEVWWIAAALVGSRALLGILVVFLSPYPVLKFPHASGDLWLLHDVAAWWLFPFHRSIFGRQLVANIRTYLTLF